MCRWAPNLEFTQFGAHFLLPLRRHLIQVHNKIELILSNEKQEQQTSKINPMLKEKFHQLSVQAIIKDNLPFNAFMKPGLAKIMKEAIPGNIKLYWYCLFGFGLNEKYWYCLFGFWLNQKYWYRLFGFRLNQKYWYRLFGFRLNQKYWYCLFGFRLNQKYWYCLFGFRLNQKYWYRLFGFWLNQKYWYCLFGFWLNQKYWYCKLD